MIRIVNFKNLKIITALALFIGFVSAIVLVLSHQSRKGQTWVSPYPDGRNFAFTITDDPDFRRINKVEPIYNFLLENGFKTTIAVWVREATKSNGLPEIKKFHDYGDTCKRKGFVEFHQRLQNEGFEIALHTVSGGNDYRDDTKEGYEEFKRLFGYYPKINIMHSNNLENIYWGIHIFENRLLQVMTKLFYRKAKLPFSGEQEESPYFWGDICKAKTKYVRMWGTSDINTLKFNPSMPYHDPKKPYVNYWFSFSDGYNVKYFNKLLSDKNIRKLVKERGTCIVYTHFSDGFCDKQKDGSYVINNTIKIQLEKLSNQKDGWFVPASEILDRLLAMKNVVVHDAGSTILVSNTNDFPVSGVTLMTKPDRILYSDTGEVYKANSEGEIIIGELNNREVLPLFTDRKNKYVTNGRLSFTENLRLIYERTKILIFSHKG
jgi:hypothetical protein